MTNSARCRLRWLNWLGRLGCLITLTLGACAAAPPKQATAPGKVTPQMRSGSPELRAYQVTDWIAPDDRTLVVNGVDRSLFEARFRGGCAGLRLANSIAFIIPTGAALNDYSGIVLPEGTHCPFASFTRLVTSPAPARGPSASENR